MNPSIDPSRSGLTWYLAQNPAVLAKLTQEIRTVFRSADEIIIAGVNTCLYLLDCIDETLRLYPPSPQPHHRIVPAGGAFVPAGMAVSIPSTRRAAARVTGRGPRSVRPSAGCSPRRQPSSSSRPHADDDDDGRREGEYGCANPDGDDDNNFRNDKREASQPFSYGPRNCVGRNLAYAEIKLVIARLRWEFDIESATEGNWMDQKVFMI
jgi:cytochrome P450